MSEKEYILPEKLKQYIGVPFDKLPQHLKRYKCISCFTAGFTESDKCPSCGDTLCIVPMCPVDHTDCHHLTTEKLAYCPLCGHQMCPVCGTHDVFQLTRITGYINDIDGFNHGKRQEVKDRVRSNIVNDEWEVEGNRGGKSA